MIPCPRCGGKGEILEDKAVGAEMRAARKKAGLTLWVVGRRLGWSAAYVSDLELGKRGWTAERQRTYLEAIG